MKTTTPLSPDILKSPKWEWHIPDAATSDAVRRLVLSDECLVKSNPVRAVYRCGEYFLKFEHAASLLTAFRNRLRPKARHEYGIGRKLEQSGIPAVKCLGWGVLRGTNVLVTRALPCSISLEEYFYRHAVYGGEEPDGIVAETTAFLRKFFDAGFFHGDLHFGNILYDPDTHAFAWVDLIAISRAGTLAPAQRLAMCRSVVTFREGLNRTQMLRAIRAIGAASTDDEAETFYFDCVRRDARRLVESWEKRRSQILGGYPKFTDIMPCPSDPARKLLLRKDWLSRPILTNDAVAKGIPAGYECFHAESKDAAETMFLRSLYLQILRVRHRRVAAFVRPNELWLEPLPEGVAAASPAPDDDPELAFFLRTLDELMIETPRENVFRLPGGLFLLRDLNGIGTGFEEP